MNNLQEKVEQMKGSEILDAMIKGLEREWTKIDMITYGQAIGNTCFGCAATNAVCEIMKKKYTTSGIISRFRRAEFMGTSSGFLAILELAIDRLRKGAIKSYNKVIEGTDIAELPLPKRRLPYLDSQNYNNPKIIGKYKQYLKEVIEYEKGLEEEIEEPLDEEAVLVAVW